MGFIGGGQIGYNWQFTRQLLAGIEADIQGVASSGNTTNVLTATPLGANTFFSAGNVARRLDYLGTARGRPCGR